MLEARTEFLNCMAHSAVLLPAGLGQEASQACDIIC